MNKIVFITGATSGIGEACAYTFAEKGYDLILNGRNPEKLEKLVSDILGKFSVNILPLIFDVRDKETASQLIENLPEKWQAIEILVNNAGLVLGVDKEYEVDLEESAIVIDTDVKGFTYGHSFGGAGNGETKQRSYCKYRFHRRRGRLSGRKCVLCSQSRRKSAFGRIAY